MNTQLTDKQIHFYRENGFLVIDDFLAGTELASWRKAVDEAVVHHLSREDTHHNQRGEGNYYKYVFVQCVNLWKTSEQIKSLVLDSRLGKLATDLAGTSGVRLYHDHAMVKLPWARRAKSSTKVRPRPRLLDFDLVVKKGSRTLWKSEGAMPWPVSLISIRA